MKCIKTIELQAIDLHKQLSFTELREIEGIIYKRIQELMYYETDFMSINNMITRSFWLPMPPHYIHFELDITITGQKNGRLEFIDEFNGPVIFFYTLTDWLLAKELYYLKHYKKYCRNNVTV
jgi:hypothetical protein